MFHVQCNNFAVCGHSWMSLTGDPGYHSAYCKATNTILVDMPADKASKLIRKRELQALSQRRLKAHRTGKVGRPRKYKNAAECQRAYRLRRKLSHNVSMLAAVCES